MPWARLPFRSQNTSLQLFCGSAVSVMLNIHTLSSIMWKRVGKVLYYPIFWIDVLYLSYIFGPERPIFPIFSTRTSYIFEASYIYFWDYHVLTLCSPFGPHMKILACMRYDPQMMPTQWKTSLVGHILWLMLARIFGYAQNCSVQQSVKPKIRFLGSIFT